MSVPPGAPPTPFSSITLSPEEQAALAGGQQQLDTTIARGNEDQANLFNETLNRDNRYSQINLLDKAFQERTRGNVNSMASRGNLYSGALVNEVNETTHQRGVATNNLTNAYQRGVQGIQRGIQDTEQSVRNSVKTALQQAAERRAAEVQPGQGGGPGPEDHQQGAPAGLPASDPGQGAMAPPPPAVPKPGFGFVQKDGPRAGLSYKVVMKGGKKYRFYENGDKVLVP